MLFFNDEDLIFIWIIYLYMFCSFMRVCVRKEYLIKKLTKLMKILIETL
jgi:hypothetical protein